MTHPWLPDVTIGFDGNLGGYGILARQLVTMDETLRALRPTSEFRCRRTSRQLRLAGNVPLDRPEVVAAFCRIGGALDMRAVCTVYLPDNAGRHRDFPRLAHVGRIGTVVLDLSGVVGDAGDLRTDVKTWLDVVEACGMDVELRGEIPVLVEAGALNSGWLDRRGFTLRPSTARPGSDAAPEVFLTLDGSIHASEESWRANRIPVGSVHGDTEAALATILGGGR
jgi:hypothetical protein